jgi:alkylation response protein AidB-like acyl-CoA dehydrogenase
LDFELSEEQRSFQAVARQFAADEMEPHAAEWDEKKILPVETLRRAAALGFAAVYVRDDVGGAGLSRLDAAIIFEELAHGCPSTAAFVTIHNMVTWMIDRFGEPEQRRRFIPDLATMKRLGSYALTEAGSGSDAAALETKAEHAGDDYVLTGSKAFTSGGGVSDLYLIMARTGGPGPSGISCFAVEKGTNGLTFGAPEKKLGWNSQPTAAVIMDGVRVPAANLIGGEGNGFKIAMAGLDGGRINIGACSLGGAQFCLERAARYLGERRQFGKRIGDFQALRFTLADMATNLAAARLMIWRAAAMLDQGVPDARAWAAMAKRFATDACFQIADQALQLHGGYGYLKDHPIERVLRDLRVHRILEGTNEIMRVIIARQLLGSEQ